MAERRMFHAGVVESDGFLDLSPAAQALYLHLGMQADDDGFVNGPRQVCRRCGARMEELQELMDGGFLLWFDGIAVVKHWRMCNNLKADRLKMPNYPDIAKKLYFGPNRIYQTSRTRGTVSLWDERADKMRSRGIRLDPNGIQLESQKRRKEKKVEEKKIEEKKIKENRSEEVSREETDSSGSACPQNDTHRLTYDDGEGDTILLQEERDGVVQLTHGQIYNLLAVLGLDTARYYVKKLAKFIKEHNANIKDHYATLMKWWQEDGGTYHE